MRKLLLALALVFMSCGDSNVTGPSPPPVPPPPVEQPPPPPPVVRGPQFSWDNVRGVLLFAGTQGDEMQLTRLIHFFKSAWPNKQLAFNVCSEVSEWESTPWNDGPAAFSKENLENLERFLRVTAENNVMVKLNIFCTMRDNHGWMQRNWERYVGTVVKVAKKFDHINLSVANEPYHPDSWLREGDRVRRVRDRARMSGWHGPMSADDTIGDRRREDGSLADVRYAYRSLGFTPEFHPFRNPNPKPRDFDQMVAENGLPLIISEPTAYSTTREGGCCTDNQQEITAYFRQAERRGITMFLHSTTGLLWPLEDFSWIPQP